MNQFEVVCQQLKQRLQPLGDLKIDPSEPQPAAVVLILRDREGEAEVLIIKRAEHPGDPWSGHLALPGGRAEAGDEDLRAVAVRETREEVGIDLDAGGHFLGRLATVWPGNPRLPRIAITPLVAIVPPEVVVRPNANEVEEAFWVPLTELQQQGRSDAVRLIIEGQVCQWPAYPSAHGSIWGITERILTQFLALLE